MIGALEGSCSYCGCHISIHAGHPFALALMPPKEEGFGWTFEPVCLMSWYGARCMDQYAEDLHEYWRLLDQRQPA